MIFCKIFVLLLGLGNSPSVDCYCIKIYDAAIFLFLISMFFDYFIKIEGFFNGEIKDQTYSIWLSNSSLYFSPKG